MKKILFFAFFLQGVCLTSIGQDTVIRTRTETVYSKWQRNNLNLRVGPEVAFPVGDFGKTNNFGIGGSALLEIPVANRFSIIAYAGLRSYGGKNGNKRATIYPLRTGINYKLSPKFYAMAQIGESVVHSVVSKSNVSQAIGVGYFNGYFDLGARWDYDYAQGGLSSIVFQARYVITFGLKRY